MINVSESADDSAVQTGLSAAPGLKLVLGNNAAMQRVVRDVERAAEVECSILICGETGTGKELLARRLHQSGPRAKKPFVPVNCVALTSTLAESQLFGHEKGAYTGALGSSLGVFRAADKGVVFLDEIGEMSLDLQPKLLRVLQEREVTPVGASTPVSIDVQVIAATNRNLEEEVAAGRFRKDLYYRLNIVELDVPPLRKRLEDLPELIDFFSQRYAVQYRRQAWRPSPEELRDFYEYPWPGNVRQLSHVIEQSYVLDAPPRIPRVAGLIETTDAHLPFLNLDRLRSTAIRQALEATKGHKSRAARLLGVHPNTLTRLLAQLDDGAARDALGNG